jgi:hypothetical protein
VTDRALRLRMDVDVRGDDEVGLGSTRTGPPGPPVRDGEAAVVLGTALARHALATLPEERRASVARDLAALEPAHAASDLAGRRVPDAAVHDLRPEEQVGARGWCARAVLGDGATAAEALIAVDAIRLPEGEWTLDWAARVPWMVPALVRHLVGDAPDALARTVIALRALGAAVAADPAAALAPGTATAAAAEALAAPHPVPGSGAFATSPPAAGETVPLAVAPAASTAILPRPPAAPIPDRRMIAALAAAMGVAVLALVLVFAIIASPGSFGLASTDAVQDRVAILEAGVGQLRTDVGTLAQELQGTGGGKSVRELQQAVGELEQQVQGLCAVLPIVC